MNNTIYKLLGAVNFILSGLIALSYAFLLVFQKNCEFCSVIVWPLFIYALFALSAYISLKLLNHPSKYQFILSIVNGIGIISSLYYLIISYLL